jgi:ATP-binding cassette subfamily B protein
VFAHFRLIRRLLPYLKPHRWRAIALVGLSALAAVFALFEPWPLALLVDGVLADKQPPSMLGFLQQSSTSSQILFAVLLGFSFTLISQVITVLTRAVDTRLELGMVLDFRSDLFNHIQRLSFQYHDRGLAGRYIYQVNYIAHDAGTVVTALIPLAQSALTLLGMFWVTYRLEPRLAIAAAAVVPLVSFATTFYGRRIEPHVVKVRDLEGDSMTIVHEKLSLVRLVVSFCREKYEHRRFREQAEVAVDARVRITILQTVFSLGVALITAAGTALVLYIGSRAVLAKQLTVGELLVVLAYVAAVYQPLETISSTLAGLQQQLIQLRVVFDVLDTEPEVIERPGAISLPHVAGRVTFEDVAFHYAERPRTVEHLTFDVAPGEFVAIVGPTGAGKSTLVSLIPRFFDPHAGRVLVDGHDIRDLTLECLRESISVVMQEPVLFMGTIQENIRYGKLDATDEEVEAAARAANCHEFISRLPHGYKTPLGERGARLSGGERQRLSVARAFLKDAPIIVLDEPTSSIDSKTEAVILDALERLTEGRTTVMIAHRLSTIRRADRILVMDDGCIVEQGTHAELVAADGLYAGLWAAQGGAARPSPTPDVALPNPFAVAAPSPFEKEPVMVRRRPKVVVLGMMTKIPVPGVVWQVAHYLVGLERLGVDAYYVEAHARTPSMFLSDETDDGSARAAAFIERVMARFGLAGRWAYHALHDREQVYGMSHSELLRLYLRADLIINLHGGTVPRPEHTASGRLVYLETDPVQLQVELHRNEQATIDFLEPHAAFFTFGENIGQDGCRLPVSDRFTFLPTRQPVVCDFWPVEPLGPDAPITSIGNWRQQWREVEFDGETYHWSKHLEWAKVIDVPQRVPSRFRLALAGHTDEDRALLAGKGWDVVAASTLATIDDYRRFITRSRAEFTVAKDQNVRLQSGWFSDRSATYLAAGRPVVTQDTGFGRNLPTGSGLFPFTTADDAVAAFESIARDEHRHRRAARAIAQEYFAHDVVLRPLLEAVGVELPATPGRGLPVEGTSGIQRRDLDLRVASRHPTTLMPETQSHLLAAPLPAPMPGSYGDEPQVSIVIVTHDGLAFTRLCLETVLATTAGAAVEVIVVDNASSDLTPAYLGGVAGRWPNVRTLLNDTNVGFAPAVNQGLALARGTTLVVLNNDTIVPPGWLDRLEQHLGEPDIGMVGPCTNAAPNESRIPVDYGTYGEFLRFAARRSIEEAGQTRDLDVLTMFCVALKRETFEQLGPLDEQFEVGMFEDDDYAQRVRAAGLRLVCAEDVVVHHFGEGSFGALVSGGAYNRLFEANKRRFEEKWSCTWQQHRTREDEDYERLVGEVRDAIIATVPVGATVLVVSKGDDALIQLDGRVGWHFPRADDGSFAGWYPGDAADVLAQLDEQRRAGARYVAFPSTASWWFEFYDGLQELLGRDFEERPRAGDCRIFAAREPVGAARRAS